ncbi:MAG: hypothetical protein AAGF84_10065 [Planctomycetota bacterium]
MSRFAVHAMAWAVAVSFTVSGWPQTVAAPWVEVAEAQIEQHRKTDLRVIVLDDDGRGGQVPAVNAEVRIEQLRHDFPVGVVMDAPSVRGFDPSESFFRAINAVSLRRLTAWPMVQPGGPDEFALEDVETAVTWAEVFGLDVHWGGMIAADPAFQPQWAAALDHDERLRLASQYVDVVGWTFAGRLRSASLYTHHVDQPWLDEPGVRWLFNHAQTADAGFELRLGYEQALDDPRARDMMLDADDKAMGFVRSDGVAVTHAFGGRFVQSRLRRYVTRMATLGQSVLIDGLEVGGGLLAPSQLEAALITLFAEPSVSGIYLDGLTTASTRDASAALLDADGEPTGNAMVVDRLFRERWWTDTTSATDELGNVRTRVFAGHYRVTATLPDGRRFSSEVLVPKADGERVVVLEPVWSAEKLQAGGVGERVGSASR